MQAIIENNKIIGYSEESPVWDGFRGRLPLWDLTTNRKSHTPFGGLGRAAKAAAHRHLKKEGWVYYLSLEEWEHDGETNRGAFWGLCRKADLPKGSNKLVTGYTLAHCFHRLGRGCAIKGSKIYFNW